MAIDPLQSDDKIVDDHGGDYKDTCDDSDDGKSTITDGRPARSRVPRVHHRYRKGSHLNTAKEILRAWRAEAHQQFYRGTPLPTQALLPDAKLEKIAKWSDLTEATVVQVWGSKIAADTPQR